MHQGQIVAIAEERLSRKKYADGYMGALFYCLNALDITVDQVDLFVSSSYHKPLPPQFMGDLKALGLPPERFVSCDHHWSHACSTYFLSPFEKALVIVIDGLGNNSDTESYYVAEGNTITKIGGNDAARSIYKGVGRAYESFTNYAGWSAQEAGKTMGLAPMGHEVAPDKELFIINEKNQIQSMLEGKYYHGAVDFARESSLDFGKPFSGVENANAAWFVQDRVEKVIIELVRRLHAETGITKLCLAGGVFLNGITNQKILDETPIEAIFVPPCADDTGQGLGNALYGYHQLSGVTERITLNDGYAGREYSEEEILDVITREQRVYSLPYEVKSASYNYERCDDIVERAAKLLADGQIIGWFQGGSEIGPRALGHRSILSAPFPAIMKDRLNAEIKHRELFRPFAPVVIEEKLSEYFATDTPSPFMLRVAMAQPDKVDKIPAALHVDNSGRVQTVTLQTNGNFYRLVKRFGELTGVPVILNTSFNDNGEPIVETPRDALVMFCKTPLKYVVIGDYILWKNEE